MMRHPVAIAVLGSALVVSTLMRGQESKQFVELPIESRVLQDTSAIAALKAAIQLHTDKRYREAIAQYDRAASRLPQVADWIAVFAASSASYEGDTLEVARRLVNVDTSITAHWGWRARTRAFETAGARRRALQVAQAATRSGTASRRADAWYRVAELQRDVGDAAEQRTALLQALRTAPESDGARDAANVLIEREDLAPSDREHAGRVLMRHGDVTRGVRTIERALATGNLSDPSEVRYDIGRVLFNLGRYDEARKHLARVARGHSRRPEARFLIGRALYRDGETTAGVRMLREVAEAYPKSSAATRSLYLLADLAQDDGDAGEARALFAQTATAPARTSESALATMRLGAMHYAQGDYSKAATIFEQYRSRYPDGQRADQATYWLAQVALRRGDTTAGNQLMRKLKRSAPLSYYGMRAAGVLGEPVEPVLPDGPQTPAATVKQLTTQLDRWELLREVGWNEAASFELSRVRRSISGDPLALYTYAEELARRGAPHIAIEAGRSLLRDGAGWNHRLLKIVYPLPYQEAIEQAARANGLDPHFVAALIRQESRFNRNAVSGAGAVGLMQVLPRTGQALAKGTEIGPVSRASLTDAETNIKLGTRFLADLVRMYGDRLDLVLIAYNAGPSRAHRWRTFPEFAAEDLFIERIPFEETRDYVKVVQLNTAIYRIVYGGRTASR